MNMSKHVVDKILVINSGSSSLKFMLFSMATETMMAKGLVERIGMPNGNLAYQRDGEAKTEQTIHAENHGKALALACRMLIDPACGVIKALTEVDAIGHRVVHGGEKFSAAVIVDDAVKAGIGECSPLAPLHNPANLGGIVACETVFPDTPNIAVFDTAFHHTIPKHAFLYAIPSAYYENLRIRKYGFHGISYQFVAAAAAKIIGKPLEQTKLIICHLGNGSSIAAVAGGKSLDTTMGMTPLAGLIMGSRSGDLDPAVVLYLAREGKLSLDEIDTLLNKQSGLLGCAGTGSGDMRELVAAAAAGKEPAVTTLNMVGHRAALYIGGYYTLLGGADAIIFTGGVGENSFPAREAIISRLVAIGCRLDSARNKATNFGKTGPISTDDSSLPAIVIPTNEELMIARETFAILSRQGH
jgi:acetate kinase